VPLERDNQHMVAISASQINCQSGLRH